MDLKERKWDFLYVLQTYLIALMAAGKGWSAEDIMEVASRAVKLDPVSLASAPSDMFPFVLEFTEWALHNNTSKPRPSWVKFVGDEPKKGTQ